jgi:hypothetical protein
VRSQGTTWDAIKICCTSDSCPSVYSSFRMVELVVRLVSIFLTCPLPVACLAGALSGYPLSGPTLCSQRLSRVTVRSSPRRHGSMKFREGCCWTYAPSGALVNLRSFDSLCRSQHHLPSCFPSPESPHEYLACLSTHDCYWKIFPSLAHSVGTLSHSDLLQPCSRFSSEQRNEKFSRH